jgi:hypothetical protein
VTHGQIIYTQKETKKGINKKYLSDILSKYYKDDGQAKEICAFILENNSIPEYFLKCLRSKAHFIPQTNKDKVKYPKVERYKVDHSFLKRER